MKIFKYQLKIVTVLFVSLMVLGCENDDDNGDTDFPPIARFVTSVNLRTVTFIDLSSNGDSYEWNFGDGSGVSTEVNPVKTYDDNGTYTITLTVRNGLGASTFTDEIVIDAEVCDEETEENINPADGDIIWTFRSGNNDVTFEAFGDTAGFLVDNPVLGGVNNSCTVERYEKTPGCQTFAGLGIALASPIDFSTTTNKTFTMKVLAETQLTEVTLRLEFMPFPNTEPSQDRVASITTLGEWQELTFDFSDVPAGTFQSMIIYFERNAPCDGDIYYFDDIIQQ
ncbi:MAG: PKD domain-containing protein [Psychroserpens sp.]|nr:PKD domain-containing protein [Psychroserpens sp.]